MLVPQNTIGGQIMKRRNVWLIVSCLLLINAYAVFAAGTAKTTIIFSTNWIGADTKAAAFEPYLKAFSSKYPAFDLVVQSTPGTGSDESKAKYFTMAAAGTLPDVFNFWPAYGNMAPLIKGNALADLRGYIAKDPVFSKVFNKRWMFDQMTQFEENGPNYGLPAEFYFTFLFVNKKIFDDAGAPLPNTWADVKTAIPLLKAKGIVPLGWAANDGDLNTNLWVAFLDRFSPDKDVIAHLKPGQNLDEVPAFRKAYQAIEELAKMGAFPEGAASLTHPEPVISMYNQQKAAMFEGGPWYIGQITQEAAQNTIIMPLWTFPDGKPTDAKSLIGGVSMSYLVNRKSFADPKKYAGIDAFLHYVLSPDIYAQWTEAGVPPLLPVKFPATANPILIKAMALQQTVSTLAPWFMFDIPQANTVNSNQMQGLANASLTADQAYKNLAQAAKTLKP
jgi:ABC-type glycerol-3-phosphate transport system substrate-binding protein